jgi:thiol-disulfide isomerase/thioredoxin
MTVRKQVALVAVLLAAIFAVGTGIRSLVGNELSPAGVGTRAPDFAAMTLDEKPVRKTLDDYRGSVVMINIWATWCAPCRVEMPAIEQLHQAYGPKGLKIVAVSVDDPGMEPQIRSFAREFGLTFEILHDGQGPAGSVSRAYQTSGYPETVIIGRDGIIRKRVLGAHDWNSAENRALIGRLLAEPAE